MCCERNEANSGPNTQADYLPRHYRRVSPEPLPVKTAGIAATRILARPVWRTHIFFKLPVLRGEAMGEVLYEEKEPDRLKEAAEACAASWEVAYCLALI